jgi:drug/metabolite transporter (DMT)-like permease
MAVCSQIPHMRVSWALREASTISGLAVYAGLMAAIVLDTFAELFWKIGVTNASGATLRQLIISVLQQPFFLLAMMLFVPKYFNWMFVLSKADLTYAKPFTELSAVTILIVSAVVLHEPITWPKIVGIVLVMVGVYLVSTTKMLTVREQK